MTITRYESISCYKTPSFDSSSSSSSHFNCLGYLSLPYPFPFQKYLVIVKTTHLPLTNKPFLFQIYRWFFIFFFMTKGCTKKNNISRAENYLKIIIMLLGIRNSYHMSKTICLSYSCCSCLVYLGLKILLFLALFRILPPVPK